MKKTKSIEPVKTDPKKLSAQEMQVVKGGWLITCEEKRGLLGTYTAYGLKWDGSLLIKMQQP